MPAESAGSVFRTRDGYGIRWPENGKRPQRTAFKTKTEARKWFKENVEPRLRRGTPDPSITFGAFADLYLERWGATVAKRTKETVAERLVSSRERFGDWTLRELEGAAADVAKWRAGLSESSRYRLTLAFRQALGAAVRWRYLTTNPVVDAGKNPQPRTEEFVPFTRDEIDALNLELGPVYGPLVLFASETGLRTNEWAALERRDVDQVGRAVTVQRRVSDGLVTPYPKTAGSRRRVPLSSRTLPTSGYPRASTRRWCSRPRRADTSTSTTGATANGLPRSTPPGSSRAGRTIFATRSRARRWPLASRSSSLPA
jgi:integrase